MAQLSPRTPPPGTNPIRPAIIASLILTGLVIALAEYTALPDPVVSHGNAAGEPDNSIKKPAGTGLVPLITLTPTTQLSFLPRNDPLGKYYESG